MANEHDQLSQLILETASSLYLKYGLKKVTMDDISKAIGKSRTTIYYYFKNREEVFQAVLDNLVKEVIVEMDENMQQQNSFEEKIYAFCTTKIKTSEERASFFRAIETGLSTNEQSAHTDVIGEIHQRLMEAEKNLLLKVFSASIDRNEIPVVSGTKQDTIIFILLSGIRGIRREMTLKNDFKNLNATIRTLTSMVVKQIH